MTMAPPPAARRTGSAAWIPKTTPSTLTAMIVRYRSRSIRSIGVSPVVIPALRTTRSRRPSSRRATSTAARTCSGSLTSVRTKTPPTSATADRPDASSRSAITTRTPSAATFRATARPIPDAPPVISATRADPSSSATSTRRRRRRRLVAQLPAQDLAGDRLRDLVDDLDLPGILVRRHPLLAESDELLGFGAPSGLEADEGLDRLPTVGIRNPDHAALPDGRVLVEHVLDLAWPDLEAGRDDHVLLPVDQVEPALGVHEPDITGVQSSPGQRLRRLLGLVPVPRHHARALGHQLPH